MEALLSLVIATIVPVILYGKTSLQESVYFIITDLITIMRNVKESLLFINKTIQKMSGRNNKDVVENVH